ncbi:hypothetical protein HY492_00300 [Candidatus Woesearchaeota archaeon]|nr:hypothetical protein [Candidatus Woesearchaeota archaeon]
MARAQAEVAFPLTELMGIIIVAIVVGGLLIFLVRAVTAGNANAEAASEYSMFSLAAVIRDAVTDQAPYVLKNSLTYISDHAVLVGFNNAKYAGKPSDETPTYYCENAIKWVARPSACGDKACLCTYREKSANRCLEDAPLACAQLEGVDTVLTFWYNSKDDEFGTKYRPSVFARPDDAKKTENTFKGQCYPWVWGSKYVGLLAPPMFENPGTTIVPGVDYFDGTLWDKVVIDYEVFKTYYFSDEAKKKAIADKTGSFCGGQDAKYANQYASLVLFGDAGGVTGHEFRTDTLMVEKVRIDDRTRVLVALPMSDALVKQRREMVERQRLDEVRVLAGRAFTAKDWVLAVKLYDEYFAHTEITATLDAKLRVPAQQQAYQAHAEYVKTLTTPSERLNEYQYLVAHFENWDSLRPLYDDAKAQKIAICATAEFAKHSACAG